MSWNRIEKQIRQHNGKALHRGGTALNDDSVSIDGRHEERTVRLQERYGTAKHEAQRQVDEVNGAVEHLKKTDKTLTEQQNASTNRKKAGARPAN